MSRTFYETGDALSKRAQSNYDLNLVSIGKFLTYGSVFYKLIYLPSRNINASGSVPRQFTAL